MSYKDVNDYEILYMIGENNEDAYNLMHEKYKPIITKLASFLYKKYNYCGIERDDLILEGMFGLNEALKKFDIKDNVLFYSFALICIKREMIRCVTTSIRQKHVILNEAISIDYNMSSSDDEFTIKDLVYNEDDFTDKLYFNYELEKKILDLKYILNDMHSLVYELKYNGFSNGDICLLLDIKYKDVDNYLRSIKKTLKKYINNCRDIDFS